MNSINEYRDLMNKHLTDMRKAKRHIEMLQASGEDTTQAQQAYDEAESRFRDAQAKKEALQTSDPAAAAVDAQEQAEQRHRREVSDPFGQARGWGS